MSTSINLSYVLTTRNRLPFLKITLQKLLEQLQPDEEVVVVDAESTDGTQQYLSLLLEEGKIHQYISEPDRNQAQGWNKAMLLARGIIIKKIIDDDVYDLDAIRVCSNTMLNDARIDICISNYLSTHLLLSQNISIESRVEQYRKWKNKDIASFTFSDVSMLIRKSSLSYLGLYDTQFNMMDWEYALRCSYLKANISYYSGFNALAVGTPGNVTSKTSEEQLRAESLIGKQKYNYAGDRANISLYSELKIAVGKMIYPSKRAELADVGKLQNITFEELQGIYAALYQHLQDYNKAHPGDFI
jgi:glycosyltransferase involved in cell wall biosynthesis